VFYVSLVAGCNLDVARTSRVDLALARGHTYHADCEEGGAANSSGWLSCTDGTSLAAVDVGEE